ncbi:A disintegrin and metalloproteinase with thrombospondin motifs 3-like isoform X2 [Prorops nasuta]|uniref:A disintegrin and metalloproteinase with thrombospondin motifs 3-like isoform X2 n=1 Tax=Prorops nasuta TaxID=863751 RepID=UPI0034CD2A3B
MAGSKLYWMLLAMWWLGSIDAKSRNDQLLMTLEDYEIVYPSIQYIPKGSRGRRSTETLETRQDKDLLVRIGNWTLRTKSNDRLFIPPNLKMELISSNIQTIRELHNCEFRQGHLLEKRNESVVVLTICENEIYALMILDETSFCVQPLFDGQRHVLYESKMKSDNNTKGSRFLSGENMNFMLRRNEVENFSRDSNKASSLMEDAKIRYDYREFKRNFKQRTRTKRMRRDAIDHSLQIYDLSGDNIYLDYNKVHKFDNNNKNSSHEDHVPTDSDTEPIGYFFDRIFKEKLSSKKIEVKETSTSKWLELAVAVDYSLIQFHGERAQQYVLALLNIVSAIYKDPSLESNMNLVISRMIFYADKKDGMVRYGNARRSLENVNKWNQKLLSSSEGRHDAAVWLTRLDIGGPSGYAPVLGLCDPARSCALNRDEGLTSAFIIAHEVAHILGLSHDGDGKAGNTCGKEASAGSIMAPIVAATFHRFHWSKCSRKEFHRRTRKWLCLLNRPNHNNATELEATLRQAFTMDEQCRMEFGEGYKLCERFGHFEPCSHLWCGNTNVSLSCKTKKGPPLEGTSCGAHKWCIDGICESIDRKRFAIESVIHVSRNEEWGAWSSWSECSRTCGVGVQIKSRKCKKSYTGQDCTGPKDEFKVCELSKCTTSFDLRAEQCSKLANFLEAEEIFSKTNLTWFPHEPDQETLKCQLICKARETNEIFYTGENVIDGTQCSYGSSNICITGQCHGMGCDFKLGSKKEFDSCGVCGGDNSSCENVVSKFHRKLRRGMNRVVILPNKAYNLVSSIAIVEGPSLSQKDLTLVIRDGRRRRNDADNLDARGYDSLIVEGAAFWIKKSGIDTYAIEVKGQALSEVVISMAVSENIVNRGITVSVSTRYTINRDETNYTSRYIWLHGGWGPCSASCEGGQRRKTLACQDKKTGRIVSRKKCPLALKPTTETEKCNVWGYHFKWLAAPWESCSVTCGSSGIQRRQIYCVQSAFNATDIKQQVYRLIVSPTFCKNRQRPITERECNKIPCLGHWVFTEWSPVRELLWKP